MIKASSITHKRTWTKDNRQGTLTATLTIANEQIVDRQAIEMYHNKNILEDLEKQQKQHIDYELYGEQRKALSEAMMELRSLGPTYEQHIVYDRFVKVLNMLKLDYSG